MKILAGNWKMHKTVSEAEQFANALKDSNVFQKASRTRSVLIPSPTLLQPLAQALKGTKAEVFSQNVSYAREGAWTGEISPLQLQDIGITGTLVGHSERRTHFGENDKTCQERATLALELGLEVIYCIGETLEEREAGQTKNVLLKQLEFFCAAVKGSKSTQAVVAYEPVWAIGTGKVAGPEQVREAHLWIHEALEKAGTPTAILYGGSVKPSNFKELSSIKHVSGALVGGASLKAEDFVSLLEILEY